MSDPTIFQNLVNKFAKNGLTPEQQSELDSIMLAGNVDRDSTFWCHFLPIYFLMARREDEKINISEFLTAAGDTGKNKSKPVDQIALADSISARLADMLDELVPNVDPVVLARAVTKAAVPAIAQAVEDATANITYQPKVDLTPLQAVIKESLQQVPVTITASSHDAFFNRHIIIMAMIGILLGIAGIWYGGYSSDQQWQAGYTQQQNEIKDLKAALNQQPLAKHKHYSIGGV